MENNVFKMKLHTTIYPEDDSGIVSITKVPGGWIYNMFGRPPAKPVFVPEPLQDNYNE